MTTRDALAALAAIAALAGLTFFALLPYIETNRDRRKRQEEMDK
jgi:hypothetical protein